MRLGLAQGQLIRDLTSLDSRIFASFFSLLSEAARQGKNPQEIISEALAKVGGEVPTVFPDEIVYTIPLVPPEVWGAGVTYTQSRDAREVETTLKGLYRQVYDAERPEIFFKTTGLRCVGPGQEVHVRSDSKWSVPEPELAVVFGENQGIAGYTIGNDMSARDIEGENALYLPQAKIFKNCCAIGPFVVTPDEIGDPKSLEVRMRIKRGSSLAFEGMTSTSKMKRSIEELVDFLRRDNPIPAGTVLLTGTGIVPPDDFSLKDGDEIEIEIEKIGTLKNTVRQHFKKV